MYRDIQRHSRLFDSDVVIDDTNEVSRQFSDKPEIGPAYDFSPWIPIIKTRNYISDKPQHTSFIARTSREKSPELFNTSESKPSNFVSSPISSSRKIVNHAKKQPGFKRKNRGKSRNWPKQPPTTRQPKRLKNSPRKSNVHTNRRKDVKIDLKTKAKRTSVLALSIIASLLAI